MKQQLKFLFVLILLSAIGSACNLSEASGGGDGGGRRAATADVTTQIEKTGSRAAKSETKEIVRLDSYRLRGVEFVYYKIPANLSRAELIETAQRLREIEPKAQLILVDDDSQASDYVKYAKAVSGGQYDAELPKQWAEDHIVANVQKLVSGKWMLYESYGYKEIAELK